MHAVINTRCFKIVIDSCFCSMLYCEKFEQKITFLNSCSKPILLNLSFYIVGICTNNLYSSLMEGEDFGILLLLLGDHKWLYYFLKCHLNSELVDFSKFLGTEVDVRLCLRWRQRGRRLCRVQAFVVSSIQGFQSFLLNESHHLLTVALYQRGGSGSARYKLQQRQNSKLTIIVETLLIFVSATTYHLL